MTDAAKEFGEYLQSPQILRDVTLQLQGGGIPFFWSGDAAMSWCLTLVEEGPWRRLEAYGTHAYFRSENDRYIVTDLGDGQRTHAMRTGDIEIRGLSERVPGTLLDQAGRVFACTETTGSDRRHQTVAPADLPAALCRVMLASYQVANLEPERTAPP